MRRGSTAVTPPNVEGAREGEAPGFGKAGVALRARPGTVYTPRTAAPVQKQGPLAELGTNTQKAVRGPTTQSSLSAFSVA